MGKLSILGAQRVKALQEILEEQKKTELATVAPKYPSDEDVLSVLETEYPGIKSAVELVRQVYGRAPSYDNYRTPWYKAKESLSDTRQVERDAISAKYDDKARQLWLCETLEEAKAIVYGVSTESTSAN